MTTTLLVRTQDDMKTCIECKQIKKINAKDLCLKCYGKFSMRKYRLLHPEEDKKRKRDWYQAHKMEFCLVRKKSRILKKYGLTLEEYEHIKVKQNNKCLICKNDKELVLDHSHDTGNIRGMLCDSCNQGLGYFRDNPAILIAAAKYLLDFKKRDDNYYSGGVGA